MADGPPLDDSDLDALLELSEIQQQAAFLQTASLLHAEGLSALLDQAMQIARGDPARARQLASICAQASGQAEAPSILPRATYARAQTHAINGEFEKALELIQEARSQYETVNDPLAAVRTNLGKMHVLNELGRQEEALAAGEETLRQAGLLAEQDSQTGLIAALAYMNRGVCFETLGRYEEAFRSYEAAEQGFIKLEMEDRLGDVYNNRGIVLVHLGRVGEALQAFEAALEIWQQQGLELLQAQTLSNIGEAQLLLGNYTRSLNAYEAARAIFERLDAGADHSILLRKTADAYLALNLQPEAVSTYRQAVEMLADSGMVDHSARAHWGLGAALTALGQVREAEERLEKAADLFRQAGNIPMLCSVLLEQASLKDRLEDRLAARLIALQAMVMAHPESWPLENLYANLRLSELYLPDLESAEIHLESAARMARFLRLPTVDTRILSRTGHLCRLQGRMDDAREALEQALDKMEGLRGNLAHEAIRTSFLSDKAAVYDDLIQVLLAGGREEDLWQAFAVSDRAKSRTLVDMQTGAVAHEQPDPGEDGLAGELQNKHAELSAIYNQLFETGDASQARIQEMQNRAASLEQEISRLRLQSAGRQSADPLDSPLPLEPLRSVLQDGEVLLAFHVLDDRIIAFLVQSGNVQLIKGFRPLADIREMLFRLGDQWERFKAGPDFVNRNLAALERSTNHILEDLYRACFAPFDRVWEQGALDEPAKLTIIPHGLLHQVPFHALYDGNGYLVDRAEIAYAPSAAVYWLCRQRTGATFLNGLVAAVADTAIPLVEEEARAVAASLEESGLAIELHLGEAATTARIKAGAGNSDLLHLACHGLFRSDNPIFSALKLEDGWLTAADILDLRLKPGLIVLSACETGRSRVLQGEELIGFPRAFLGAGASSILVSQWLAQDEPTTRLMTDLYRGIGSGEGLAAALRHAQIRLRSTHPHPYYWAPFVLIGKR